MAQIDFVKMEERVLKFWQQEKTFEKSLKKRRNKKRFVFYEGPPFANGRPGIHHVLARAYKDIILRYKTMQGFFVERKGGWDTHGLPVELQIEKELGLNSKKDIEKYGVAKFIKKCRESVWGYKEEWERLTERIGFWLDLENAYITYDPKYIESLWWIIKQYADKGLLYKDYKVVPYCPRCGTPESSHELAQGYQTVQDHSVYVKFPVKEQRGTYILAWTTTPWTLPGNVALAVGKNIQYVCIKQGEEIYIVAKKLVSKLEGEYKILKEVSGKELEGIEYEPLFDSLKGQPEKKHYVALGDFVSTEEGTGIVHTAVMYGEDDYKLGQKLGLPKKHTVDEEGKFNELVPQWKGVFVKDAEPSIIEGLKKRNLLYKEEAYEHEYPFCWRCSTPLLYYAKDSWFVNMQKVKKDLQANNERINWIPSYIKKGRMGAWLKEVRDWAFSRERYWGTPLPVWECDSCEHYEVVDSLENLGTHTVSKNTYFLVRHGESLKNKLQINVNWPEKTPSPLTRKGELQAKKAAKLLKTKKIDMIISSDLVRTKQTAEIIAKELGLKLTYDKRMRESDMGIFNGKSIEDFGAYFRKEGETPLEHFLRRFKEAPPKGETYIDIQKRMFDLVQAVEQKYQGKNILFVGHELPTTLLEGLLKGFSREEVIRFRMKHAIGTGEIRKIKPRKFPYSDDMEIDLHRPFIDEIEFACTKCKDGQMKRVKDVVDVWFDSGAMPFASGVKGYPADYIVEAVDQTRGWFYTLLAVSTLLGKKAPPYKNAISLGHILDEKGEKMSKSKGNIVDPWDMIEKYGVDVVRWYFYTTSNAGDPKLFSEKDVQQAQRSFLMPLWNSYIFYETYAYKKLKAQNPKSKTAHILDQWISSRLHTVVGEVTSALEVYDVTKAARALESFVVNDLSLWYIRRSRSRFQNPNNQQELQEASQVLGMVLMNVCTMAAPFIPFLTEEIFRNLQFKKSESVHLQNWAESRKSATDKKLEEQMQEVRYIVTQGLAERAKAGIKVRQPLASFQIQNPKSKIPSSPTGRRNELIELIKDELNVKEVVYGKSLKLDRTITPQLKREGQLREIIRTIQQLRKQAGYQPRHRVRLRYAGEKEIKEVIQMNEKELKRIAGIEEIIEGDRPKQTFDVEQEFSLDGLRLWFGIKKL